MDLKNCKECADFLNEEYGITCGEGCNYADAKKAVRRLYLTLHPDKGGDEEMFKIVSDCVTKLIDNKCAAKLVLKSPKRKDKKSPKKQGAGRPRPQATGAGRPRPQATGAGRSRSPRRRPRSPRRRPLKPCKSHQRRNEKNRCVNVRKPTRPPRSPRRQGAGAHKSCRPDQIRNPETGRCVLRSGKIGQKIMRERRRSP